MEHIGSRESDLDFDLEAGETESSSEFEEDEIEESGKHSGRSLNRGRSGYLYIEGSITANNVVGRSNKVTDIDETRNMTEGGIEKRMVDKQKRKGSAGEKHPKPPRPPTGPALLHAADIELVKEISKRTRLRHARRERMKSLKNSKTDRTSNINCVALFITAIFCIVIIFQAF